MCIRDRPNSAPYNLDDYVIADNTAIELTLQDEETAPFGKCLRLKALKALTASSNGIFIYLTQDTLEEGKQYSFSLWMKATANTKDVYKRQLFYTGLLAKHPTTTEDESEKLLNQYISEGGEIGEINEFLIKQYSAFQQSPNGKKKKKAKIVKI